MGRASKSWGTIVKKAKSLVGLKSSSRKSKEVCSDITNELPRDHTREAGVQSSELENGECRVEEKIDTLTPPPVGEVNDLQTLEIVPQDECRKLSPESRPFLNDEEQQKAAAVKIQSAFRGAMARKRLKAMKAIERLRTVLHGKATKKQTNSAMRCMQSYAKMQSQVKIQRARLSEFQFQQRKEQEQVRKTEEELDWDDSTLSREQIQAKVRTKHQAAAKRERTLAYAFSHQRWRSYPRELIPPHFDEEKPAWTWNWLEQWMSTRSWKSLEDEKLETSLTVSPSASPIRKFSKAVEPNSPSPANGKTGNGKTISVSPKFCGSPHRNKALNGSYGDKGGGGKSPLHPAWKGGTKSSPLHPAAASRLTKIPSPLHPATPGSLSRNNKSLLPKTGVLTPNNVRQSPNLNPTN